MGTAEIVKIDRRTFATAQKNPLHMFFFFHFWVYIENVCHFHKLVVKGDHVNYFYRKHKLP